jgi:hypothetical protein
VHGELPADVTLRDLGEHRLKDLLNPERLWQLVAPDLRQDFPPLQSLNAIPNNLPVQLTSFIGREKELTHIQEKLTDHRLVTLTGSGGVGKTRLAFRLHMSACQLPPRRMVIGHHWPIPTSKARNRHDVCLPEDAARSR